MDPVKTMVETLTRIREAYGEDKFKYAAAHSIRMILAQHPERKEDIREALAGMVDVDELLQKNTSKYPDLPTGDMMFQAIRQSMPGIQTQAQFDVTMSAFDALRAVLNAIFLSDKEGAKKAQESLLSALTAAHEVTDLSIKLSQVPEAATSAAAEQFKRPPSQYVEMAVKQELEEKLEKVTGLAELNDWYKTNRSDIDRVTTQALRNELVEKIRAKKREYANASE